MPYFLKSQPEITCKRCLFNDAIAEIDGWSGECVYCELHDKLERDGMYSWDEQIQKIKNKRGKYNCLIGISGGVDSSLMLYLAVKVWGLKPLVIHFCNGYNTEQAEANMKNLVDKLGVDLIRYSVNKIEYDKINEAFLEAGVADADLANDVAMTKLMYRTADQYGIKVVLNGHSIYTEGSTPKTWTRIDSKYLESVYEWYTKKKLENYPLLTIWDQIYYGLKGIKQIRPFHNFEVDKDRVHYEAEMKQFIGWQDYGSKHAENVYTEFIGSFVLPKKFGIDKRIVYLSALVRSGRMKREDAMLQLSTPSEFDLSKLPKGIIEHISPTISDRDYFKQYNFKRYRILFWVLCKLGVVPKTMYEKYCK